MKNNKAKVKKFWKSFRKWKTKNKMSFLTSEEWELLNLNCFITIQNHLVSDSLVDCDPSN